ncbi:transcription factor IBH1-like [Juglans microcarpa x Juglans regia]|uniref:transcription factor IBH1-like n=1 Tax=Juglans microcarpa x Juglans regia TaxID=2249226 RepID=UPI001B7DE534|nr:transcription factor IBH1-like [Juglans microcarpa x Juglans regia]
MNPRRSISSNPASTVKSRFTNGFLQALLRINRQRITSTTAYTPREIFRGYLRVKIAADVSMASAIGSRRAWSRAILRKVRSHGRDGAQVRRMSFLAMRKRNLYGNIKCVEDAGFHQANVLRKLVPGGEAMDMCCLLGETAHYIKCLKTQVKVMGRIAEVFST